jgi:hypothetical protein
MNKRIWLLLSLLATSITSLYTARILVPWNQHRAELQDGVKTQMGDLYSPWVGTRELLLRHRNPYGPEVSREIQIVFYGHAIIQTYQAGSPITNEQRFAYPVYAVFLLAPTVFADFEDVSPWARVAFGLLTAISVLFYLDILRWRMSWEVFTALLLFTLSSPQIVQGLRFEQLALVVGFLIATAVWSVNQHHLMTAGALLALSTIKPQMALLPLCWLAVWAAGDWPRRRRLAAGFVIAMTALLAAGELVLPGWFGYFLAGIAAYRKYAPTSSLLRTTLGETLGEIMGGILVLALLLLAWRNRKAAASSRQFTTTFAAFLTGSILAFPLFTPFNQVLLILPAMLLIRDWNVLPRFSRIIFIISVSWPCIISSVLLLFPPRLDSPNQLPLLPSFLVLFFPLLLPLLLMTRRNMAPQLRTADCNLGDT